MNARAYARVEDLLAGFARYEVNSYLAAPDNTCKGIMRGVDHNELRDMIAQSVNLKALEVKRIKDTTTIIILFDGLKVPTYVMRGATILRYALYRRQMDVWYTCGRLGDRAEVCPTPSPEQRHTSQRISQRTRPPSNAYKRSASSVAGGGSGMAPKKNLRRRGRPAAKDMMRACGKCPRGGAPPRHLAAADGPEEEEKKETKTCGKGSRVQATKGTKRCAARGDELRATFLRRAWQQFVPAGSRAGSVSKVQFRWPVQGRGLLNGSCLGAVAEGRIVGEAYLGRSSRVVA
ncbi:hypothetical protein HPB52_005497 [Rhipicephalus sanguineus]|uniref:Uncharacterized protein n=1 Tax=Rhipicephalus sanguineus TaxID=34632 RepID=A0A9D4QGT7_RHISA|nr:hypothetical protein HPB52_005497 [Rhipicephalus sanguineus]